MDRDDLSPLSYVSCLPVIEEPLTLKKGPRPGLLVDRILDKWDLPLLHYYLQTLKASRALPLCSSSNPGRFRLALKTYLDPVFLNHISLIPQVVDL